MSPKKSDDRVDNFLAVCFAVKGRCGIMIAFAVMGYPERKGQKYAEKNFRPGNRRGADGFERVFRRHLGVERRARRMVERRELARRRE
jgi:hypothetical protein